MKPRMMVLLGALTIAAIGCSKEQPAPKTPAPAEVKETPPPVAPTLSLDDLKKDAATVALTPSPVEMQAALAKNGIAQPLAGLIKNRDIQTNVPSKDQVAVRTGVVVADLVLTAKEASKEDTIKRLTRIKEGLLALGAGGDVTATIDELTAAIQNDAITRDKLVMKMDDLSGAIIPEIEYEAGPQVVPLIQAGSWLEGANLVSKAIRASGKYTAADALLKQPDVVDYFLKYVQTEGQDKAPDEVVKKLEETLKTLKEVTSKPTLSEQDVTTINVATDSVLALL